MEHGNEMRIWFNAMPNLRCIQLCGEYDVDYNTSQFMIPGSFNLTNFVQVMHMAVEEWKVSRKRSKALHIINSIVKSEK